MISIDFNSFWKDDDHLKKSTIEFVKTNIRESSMEVDRKAQLTKPQQGLGKRLQSF